jgi:hypothetical protein
MNTEALFLFLILLFSLLLCSFLGGNCGKEGMTGTNENANNQNANLKEHILKNLISNQGNGNQGGNMKYDSSSYSQKGNSNQGGNYNQGGSMNYDSSSYSQKGNNNYNQGGNMNYDSSSYSQGGNYNQGGNNNYNQGNFGSKTGNNYDNYNHFSGSSTSTTLTNGTTFYGPNGGTVVVSTDSNGRQSLKIKLSENENEVMFNPANVSSSSGSSIRRPTTEGYLNYNGENGSAVTFNGPNNSTATIINGEDGREAIHVETANGSYTFTQQGSVYNQDNNISSTQYYGSVGSPIQTGYAAEAYVGPTGNSVYHAEGPRGNEVYGVNNDYDPYQNGVGGPRAGPGVGVGGPGVGVGGPGVGGPAGPGGVGGPGVAGPGGVGTPYYGPHDGEAVDYSSSLPPGIPGSQIPPGKEDLYILKSEVVPPVCPVCPAVSSSRQDIRDRQEPYPACPPCGRCPEPSFECKKVPNYNAINDNFLPQPILSDFSSFGM